MIAEGWSLHGLQKANMFQVVGFLDHHVSVGVEWNIGVEPADFFLFGAEVRRGISNLLTTSVFSSIVIYFAD